MDNVTHALAGLALAEAAVQLRARRAAPRNGPSTGPSTGPSAPFRRAAWLTGLAAANLPDADVFYTAALGDPLGYLLHHRGYTHTVLGALAGAVMVWAAALALWRWRARRRGAAPPPGEPPTAADARWLLALAVPAVLSHLALDWTNDYGVHPWWPADDRWGYGDRVFIVEPWLWVAAVPPLAWAAARRAARAGLALVLAAGLALAWAVPLVPRPAALALTAAAALWALAARRLAPAPRAAATLGAWALAEGAFAAGAGAAGRHAAAAARATDPAARLVDVVVTPRPGTPLCAGVLLVETAGPGRATYRVTAGWASAAPGLVPAARCRAPGGALRGAAVVNRPTPRAAAGTAAAVWDAEWAAPVAELAALARGNCHVAALLRYARVPYWLDLGDGTVAAGDLRYTRGPGAGFADLLVPARPAGCPAGVPPWRPPRADLLGG